MFLIFCWFFYNNVKSSYEKGKNATPGYAAICQHRSTQMGHLKTTAVNVVILKKQGWNVKN